jgi:hypothetical protein
MNKSKQCDETMTGIKEPSLDPRFAIFEQWKTSGDRIMTIVENTPSGICITDEQGLFEYVNPAYCSIYGYAPQELIGNHFTIVVPEDHRSWLIELHDKFIAGTNEVRGEWPVKTKTGEQLFILADAVRITGTDGHPKKVTFVVDITARKKAEDELARSENLLREAVATKDKFFSIIAHDLRNSFHALIGCAELLMMETNRMTPAKVLAHGKRIYQASQSALDLLNNLLTWARSQTGTIQCRPHEVNLATALNRAMDPLLNKAETKNIFFEVHVPENLFVFVDIDMLNTILINLLSNALKFSNKGNSVTITAREDGDKITVAVSDTGVGMDKDMLEQLFRPGSQRRNKGTEGEQGTGLGLVLCKEFVGKNGGKIWVQSSVGKGSTFSFALPKPALADGEVHLKS